MFKALFPGYSAITPLAAHLAAEVASVEDMQIKLDGKEGSLFRQMIACKTLGSLVVGAPSKYEGVVPRIVDDTLEETPVEADF